MDRDPWWVRPIVGVFLIVLLALLGLVFLL